MGSRFGRKYPGVLSNQYRITRERFLFIAAAGMASALAITLVVVLNFKEPVKANQMNEMQEPVLGPGTILLYAPEQDVRAATKLSEVSFREKPWPRNEVPRGAVRDYAEMSGKYARENLKADFPITRDQITADPKDVTLPVSRGMRAVAIPINMTSGVEMFVQPGSHVDVSVTHRRHGEWETAVVVQNARVLSLGGKTGRQKIFVNQTRSPSKTVTLEVSREDSLAIPTAMKLGDLTLSLRAPDDNAPHEEPRVGPKKFLKLPPVKKVRCVDQGSVIIQGKGEMVVDCRGQITRVDEPFEP